MLSRVVKIQARVAPIRTIVTTPMRKYADTFKNREDAAENMYIRKKEEEKLKAISEKLKKAEENLNDVKTELKNHIENSNKKN